MSFEFPETHLKHLREKYNNHPHPYNAMIFGMWSECYGFAKKSLKCFENSDLYMQFLNGWQASRDAKIISGKIFVKKSKK